MLDAPPAGRIGAVATAGFVASLLAIAGAVFGAFAPPASREAVGTFIAAGSPAGAFRIVFYYVPLGLAVLAVLLSQVGLWRIERDGRLAGQGVGVFGVLIGVLAAVTAGVLVYARVHRGSGF